MIHKRCFVTTGDHFPGLGGKIHKNTQSKMKKEKASPLLLIDFFSIVINSYTMEKFNPFSAG